MERTYRGLGFDPAPGEPDSVAQMIIRFTAAAEALAGLRPALRQAGELSQDWHGPAADAFRARLRSVPSGLDIREHSLRRAAEVLGRWAEVLGANRRHAEELDERAVRLRKRIGAAMDDLQDRQNAADLAATRAVAGGAAAELAAATDRVADLESALAEVLAEARRLERDHLRAADAFADELERVRGADVSQPARTAAPFARTVGQLLGRASQTSSTLAGLLLPGAGPPGPVPTRAAGALAAAISSSGQR